MNDTILEVRDLSIDFHSDEGVMRAVDGVSFTIQRGEILGLVGESGAGKTLTSEAILRLIRCPPGRISGAILYRGRNLLQLGEADLASIRGKEIAMIFQNPISSLNPVFRVGEQLLETMALHLQGRRHTLWQKAIDILTRVGIPMAGRRAQDYPHQFSGGMCQRVMIGMGIACTPSLLVADEPTTALDVTIQAQILALIRQLAAELGMAVLLVSHDLGIISQMCHRVIVMYAGKIVEEAPMATIFHAPEHPYTRGLMACIPRLDEVPERLGSIAGVMPGLRELPSGCRFHPRCPIAEPRCAVEEPKLRTLTDGHRVACHLAGNGLALPDSLRGSRT
jgi:oligopeptide/dipeptide ABC transporter ATP-binding protein